MSTLWIGNRSIFINPKHITESDLSDKSDSQGRKSRGCCKLSKITANSCVVQHESLENINAIQGHHKLDHMASPWADKSTWALQRIQKSNQKGNFKARICITDKRTVCRDTDWSESSKIPRTRGERLSGAKEGCKLKMAELLAGVTCPSTALGQV